MPRRRRARCRRPPTPEGGGETGQGCNQVAHWAPLSKRGRLRACPNAGHAGNVWQRPGAAAALALPGAARGGPWASADLDAHVQRLAHALGGGGEPRSVVGVDDSCAAWHTGRSGGGLQGEGARAAAGHTGGGNKGRDVSAAGAARACAPWITSAQRRGGSPEDLMERTITRVRLRVLLLEAQKGRGARNTAKHHHEHDQEGMYGSRKGIQRCRC
jgi:hypothetical protein